MQVLKYEEDSVLIKDGDIEAWVDVWVEDGDIRSGWNKYIFHLTNSKDVDQRDWQDNCDNFIQATELAEDTIIDAGYIKCDEEGRYYTDY